VLWFVEEDAVFLISSQLVSGFLHHQLSGDQGPFLVLSLHLMQKKLPSQMLLRGRLSWCLYQNPLFSLQKWHQHPFSLVWLLSGLPNIKMQVKVSIIVNNEKF
jgi:hypothetical protein